MKKKVRISLIILLIILLIYILFLLFNTSNKYINKNLNVLFTVISKTDYDLSSDTDNKLKLEKDNQLFLHKVNETEFDLIIENDEQLIDIVEVDITYNKNKYDIDYENDKINLLLPEDTRFIHIVYDPEDGTYEFVISKENELYKDNEIIEIDESVDDKKVGYYTNNNIHLEKFGVLLEDGSFLSNDSIWYSNHDKNYDLKDEEDFDKYTEILNSSDIELSDNGFITITKDKVTFSFLEDTVTLWEKQDGEIESEDPEEDSEILEDDATDVTDDNIENNNNGTVTVKPGNMNEETIEPDAFIPSDDEIITDSIQLAFFENVDDLIYPGISSYTDFSCINKNSYNIKLNIMNIEQDGKTLPIPFQYKLKVNGNYVVSEWSTLEEIKKTQITVNSTDKVDFELEWLWPYEGNDVNDTTIGEGLSLDKEVIMTVYLEQA